MRYHAEPAFVLHARRWRETSLLVEVLTQNHGRIGLVARGVTGPRRHALRAALQPLQHIRLEAVQRGELAWLDGAEQIDSAPVLAGEATLAGFYLGELLLRLVPRQDPQPGLYALYRRTRDRLRAGEPLAWTLRRFERDLLEALGVGFDFGVDGAGEPLDPAARYRIEPDHGPRRVRELRPGERGGDATGRGLLALAADTTPEPEDLPGLRRALREALSHQLGGRGLKSWELMGELGRFTRR
ncbi:DNA repair protein RecO [Luteimonas sp. JM171]|uniref:DNA repair protein RecO n=1 Tax=Luteimonas sp. JM171 TaxID=1896164 RepID=UPI000856771C|nr:DNA repair protein RecO [Luteimonas sp. JM171]AOH36599.1 DNA repair protein RecO [Luteimonas sp. JM171]